MPVSHTTLRSRPLLALGLAALGACLAWQPCVAAGGGPRRPGTPQSLEQRRVEQLSRRATDRMRVLQAEADELASREGTLLEEIERLELDRQIKTEELAAIDGELAETATRLEAGESRIAGLEREVEAQRPLVEARLVELYKMGPPQYARLLLSADDLMSVGRAYRLIGSLARRDRERFETYRQTLTALHAARASLVARRAEVAALQVGARAARLALERAIASQTAVVEEIDARRDVTARLAGELEAIRQQLDAAHAELAAGASPTAISLALPLRLFRGEIEPPVPGEITVPFSAQQATGFGTTEASGGIQLAAVPGESVYAVHEGEVVFAGPFEGLGTLVILDHGDEAFSLYGYLASLAVHEGVRVDERAWLGTTGASPTGDPVVYFELRIDGRPVDPVEWLKLVAPRVSPQEGSGAR